ncbi:26S proteasome non-ATPase regulatory subunit 5 [Mortierella alpina]|uniref:26S proteasome non-ATPase regulatory subunit 5 n=1 Tax=Mortierella alpina TaxID=64518 RepID=A0A9P6J826_MORAP|nr:26S proteasome non-ATPase regulatory subunit 5 [Mortierella alpina]
MPAVELTSADSNQHSSQLEQTLSSLTSLTDPLAINDALLVLDYALRGSNSSQVSQQILQSVPLAYFFQLLQADHGDDTEYTIDRTCHILEQLLREQPYSAIIQDPVMAGALLLALQSPSPRVHALGLTQVDKVAKEETGVLKSMLESDVFKAVIDGVGSESISIAERSKQTLRKLCHSDDRLRTVINYDRSLSLIRSLVHSKNYIVQLRMMETLTELAAQSNESTTLLEEAGLLEPLLSGLETTDILARFNIIEILAEFGATTAGSEFLDHAGILTRLAAVVEKEADQDSLGVIAIVKLYGKLGASEQVEFVTLDMKFQILAQLERLLIGDGNFEPQESQQVEAMAAFGLIGGNIQNVEWVSQSQCAQSFINHLQSLSRDSKVTWYHSLAQILDCSSDPSPETERVVAEFYEQLECPGQSPFALRLLVSAKSQTVDLAMAALSVMIPLARYPFGVKKLGSQRDVINFLLDRTAEISHSEKHEIIVAMLETVQSAKAASGVELLTADQVSRLDLYRRQGPFHQRATATVSIQDIAA